ncbi:TonB-dependent receptor [Hydrocarboniphaga sp.]|uniref:TonB-dependent receptor domain-containing protein n=1 Tax=Hydrocarboniphaga sp. TaxID=2033016 RepID=UPI00261282B2|nr:TonB-dependent receptor [Hydrocarboniphaga sp.]
MSGFFCTNAQTRNIRCFPAGSQLPVARRLKTMSALLRNLFDRIEGDTSSQATGARRSRHPAGTATAATDTVSPQESSSRSDGIEEVTVTVTAQKREERLQDVPISISAFTGDQLEAAGITVGAERFKWIAGLYFLDSTVGYDPVHFYVAGLQDGLAGLGSGTVPLPLPAALVPAVDQFTNLISLLDPVGNLVDAKATVSMKPMDDLLFYVSAQRAFKSGSFNIVNLTSAPTQIKPETVTGYEAGGKTQCFDHHVQINGAVFHTQIVSLLSGGIVQFQNADRATVQGVEADLQWAVATSLRINLAALGKLLRTGHDHADADPRRCTYPK